MPPAWPWRKAAFIEECRVRDAVFFDSAYHDSVGLGLLKSEYELRATGDPLPVPR